MKQELQGFLWFGAGFAPATILSVSYEAVRFVPMAVAFGLLCFGCGVVLFVFLSLRRREIQFGKAGAEFIKTTADSRDDWVKAFHELKMEKEAFEKEKNEFEEEKAVWEAVHSDEPNAEESK